VGKKSILPKKLLTVDGVALSLNDIQFNILKHNYANNPLIIYGLYQGIIGGPNIRKSAYTGADVYRALANNAIEFTNSNRGTYGSSKNPEVFRVSSLYERNKSYFPDFNSDLSAHLMKYLEGYEREQLQAASTLKPDINDWTITSLEGNYRELAGSIASNPAALLDSVRGTTEGDPADYGPGTVMAAAVGAGSSSTASKAKPYNRIDPEILIHLDAINTKRLIANEKNATVTIDELGEFPVDPEPESNSEKVDDN